jgi:hypothetical protein
MDIQVMARKSASKMLVETCLQVFRNELKLQNSRYSLIVVPERGMSVKEGMRGSVFKLGPTVIGMSIDTALDIERLIIALAHEMVHAEQYHQGRLKNEYISGKGWVHEWNSELNTNKGTTYRAYRNQPWEVEAFDRQEGLAKIVAAELGL